MAKNIDFMGAVYSDVPSVRLPQQGGGLAGFDDTTDATATAEDIAQGKTAYVNGQKVTGTGTGGTPVINPLSVTENGTYVAPSGVDGYSPVTVNVSGGGGTEVPENDVTFYDYDGTVVASYSASDFANLTAMPENPSHTGLTAQGWNWSLAEAKTHVDRYGRLDIGQMYITDDGKTRLYCHFQEGRVSPYLGLGVNGTVTIDWGDGSEASTLTGTSLTTAQNIQHVYATAGDYTITLTVTSGSFSFFGAQNAPYVLKASSSASTYDRVYLSAINKIYIGENAYIGNYAFAFCTSLKYITIPQGVQTVGTNVFQNCSSLLCIIIPNLLNILSAYIFQSCYSLACISLSQSVTTIGDSAFTNHYPVGDIVIPKSVTNIGKNVFANGWSINKFIVPMSVSTIKATAFSNCYGVAEYHFYRNTPPSIQSDTFSGIPSDCKIYVPYSEDHSILNAYKTATNWSAQASKMVEEEP